MKEIARRVVLPFFAVLAFFGCEKTPAPPGATPPASPSPAAASPASPAASRSGESTSDAEKALHIFCWSEYIPQQIVDAFSADTGIKVSMETYSSNEEMLAKLFAGGGNYDIIQPSEYVIEGLIKESLLTPIDHASIPNMKNLAPEFTNMSFDPGNKYSVPYMAGTVGIIVNTEVIQDDIKSYNDVFQEKFAKNIVVLDDAREIVSWGLESLGIPVNEVSDENLAKVKPLLEKWLPIVKVFDSDSPKTALLNGDVALGVVWAGEGAILLNEDEDSNGSSRRTAHISSSTAWRFRNPQSMCRTPNCSSTTCSDRM
jgi:spermidine/putrescine transport system substrate-binding protein